MSLLLSGVDTVLGGEKIQFSGKGEKAVGLPEKKPLPGLDVRYTLTGRSSGIEGVNMPAPPDQDEKEKKKKMLTRKEREKLDEKKNWMFVGPQNSTNKIVLSRDKDETDGSNEEARLDGSDKNPTSVVEKYLEERSKAGRPTNEIANARKNELKGLEHANVSGSANRSGYGPSGPNVGLGSGDANKPKMRMLESSRLGSNLGITAGSFSGGSRDSGSATLNSSLDDRSRSLDVARPSTSPGLSTPGMNLGPGNQPGSPSGIAPRFNTGNRNAFEPSASAPSSFYPSPPSGNFDQTKPPGTSDRPAAVLEFPKRKF